MNILKRVTIGCLVLLSTAAFSEETSTDEVVKNSYNYWGIGVGIPTFVSAKIGHRSQKDKQGFEYGVGVTPLIFVTEAHIFANYLYYPNPNLKGQTYIGLGLRAGGFLQIKHNTFGYIAPGVLLGREYLTREGSQRFIQVGVGPGGLTTKGFKYVPSISMTWGYRF